MPPAPVGAPCSRSQVDLVLCDVASLGGQRRLAADTVIMNPPFGTKRRGADTEFLRAAARIARGAIYSLHKSSTRGHIQGVALRWVVQASMHTRQLACTCTMRHGPRFRCYTCPRPCWQPHGSYARRAARTSGVRFCGNAALTPRAGRPFPCAAAAVLAASTWMQMGGLVVGSAPVHHATTPNPVLRNAI
jgi:hypothetical protein